LLVPACDTGDVGSVALWVGFGGHSDSAVGRPRIPWFASRLDHRLVAALAPAGVGRPRAMSRDDKRSLLQAVFATPLASGPAGVYEVRGCDTGRRSGASASTR
jgi:hypothetical protein